MDQAAEEGSMERTLAWDDGAVVAIDQCALPAVYRTLRLTSVDDVIDAIVLLAIRGAPAIGVAGGLGVALAARAHTRGGVVDVAAVRADAERLAAARPTAVNRHLPPPRPDQIASTTVTVNGTILATAASAPAPDGTAAQTLTLGELPNNAEAVVDARAGNTTCTATLKPEQTAEVKCTA